MDMHTHTHTQVHMDACTDTHTHACTLEYALLASVMACRYSWFLSVSLCMATLPLLQAVCTPHVQRGLSGGGREEEVVVEEEEEEQEEEEEETLEGEEKGVKT